MKRAFIIISLLLLAFGSNSITVSRYRPFSIDSVYVCQSKSAYAYHAYECRGLARCTHTIAKITKAQAVQLGYKACKICYR